MNIEGNFEAEALRVLRQIPGVTVAPWDRKTDDVGVDAIVRFAGNRQGVAVEVKNRANAATAWQLVHYAEQHPTRRIILIAEHTTAEARHILERHGLGVLDGLGNAHIELPGLLFHMEGHREAEQGVATKLPPTRLRGKAGIAAQALLLEPKRQWQVQELAQEADISKGLAHRVLMRLEREGLIDVAGAGPSRVRRVLDPTALLDLWIEENVDRPIVQRGFLLAQTPQRLIKEIGVKVGLAGVEYAITGAAAASLIAPFVTAVPVIDVWVQETTDLDALLRAMNAEPVRDGHNVLLMQAKDDVPLAFREKRNGLWVANRFRLYADLRRDPRRGVEQAAHLRESVISF